MEIVQTGLRVIEMKTHYISHILIRILTGGVRGMLRFYQLVISPCLPHVCRYVPSCSEYALEALDRYGLGRGVYLAVRRILRCHPFSLGGRDPVP